MGDDVRTYPYFECLPYPIEDGNHRLHNLRKITEELHNAFAAEDWNRALYWNTELRDWSALKFKLPKHTRIQLLKVYFEVITAFGVDPRAHGRFMSTFLHLSKRRYYLNGTSDLVLDWRALWRVIKRVVIPSGELIIRAVAAEDLNHLKVLAHAQQFFELGETNEMLEEFLPLFQTSILGDAFLSVHLICNFLPTSSYKYADSVLPSIFHLWNLLASSQMADAIFIEFLSRWARDTHCSQEPYRRLLTDSQLDYVFTHFLRLMKIPVGNSNGSSSKNLDAHARNLFFNKKYAAAKDMARLLIYMLPDSRIMDHLAIFLEATETFFHPSNAGAWMSPLVSLVYELVTFYQLRINRERSGETPIKEKRSLEETKERFVLLLRKVTFMSTYSRSPDIQNFAQASLQGLGYLCPEVIVPYALKTIYPSLQGLVEAHRTTASLQSLGSLTPMIASHTVWRAHLTSLITFSLPGIDANDLHKTSITLVFLTQVAQIISIEDLSETGDTGPAVQWVQQEMNHFENLVVRDDGSTENCKESNSERQDLNAEEMLRIVKSSTAAWRDILTMFLDRIFLLLENMPPTGPGHTSNETQVSNDISCLLPPFFVALSPDLFGAAIDKIVKFITSRTLYNVSDTMSAIINSLCKADAERVWDSLYTVLDSAIRSEVADNGAGSSRSAGIDVLPRDRGLVWFLRSLEGMIDAGGPMIYQYREQIRSLIDFLYENCVSQVTEYTGILVSSFLEGLVETYTTDSRRINPDEEGLPASGLESWCVQPSAHNLKIRWHTPSVTEIQEGADFFMQMSDRLLKRIVKLLNDSRAVQGRVKQDWTDILVSQFSYLENLLSGATEMFASTRQFRSDEEVDLAGLNYCSKYPAGYIFPDVQDKIRQALHQRRNEIGELLHESHEYLSQFHADDILVFDVLLLVVKTWFGNIGYQRADGSQSKLNNVYVEDIAMFKIPGKRKQYPRQYLVRRALLYHVQRTKHSALTVDPTPLHWTLLNDLKGGSVGLYTEIRIIAQSALNLALRAVADIRASVIPFFLEALQPGDDERIKGALYMLSGKGLKNYIGRDYRFFPTFLKQLILLNNVDKPSMQMPVKQAFLECALKSRPPPGVCSYEKAELAQLEKSADSELEIAKFTAKQTENDTFREQEQLKLRDELVEMTKITDWRISCAAASALGAGISSASLPPSIKLASSILELSVADHPHLRAIAMSQLAQLLATCWLRVLTKGNARDAVLENLSIPGRTVLTSLNDGNFGRDILAGLRDPHPKFFVDNERAGWLAWPQQLEVFERNNGGLEMELDTLTHELFQVMGPKMNAAWILQIIEYWKEEPKEGAGKFRTSLQHVIRLFFVCSRRMPGSVTLEELKPTIEELCAKGALHYHSRVGAEMMSGLIGSLRYESDTLHDEIWQWCEPILRAVLTERLTPDNVTYWQNSISSIFLHRDPRRFFPLMDVVSSLPLDMESHSAFAESAKILVLRKMVAAIGWHYQSGEQAIQKFIAHVDHSYKKVRDEIGRALNSLFAMQYFESHATVYEFIEANSRSGSSLGVVPYQPNDRLTAIMHEMFAKLHNWRLERVPGQEAPTSYTMGSKTMATWVYNSVDMTEAYLLLPFVPKLILPEILHMMDVKEDNDLLVIAVGVFKQLGNVVYPISQIAPMVDSLVDIMTSDPSWHHRLRIMAVVQVFFYRNMFILTHNDRQRLFDAIVALLFDAQLDVREGASSTISGMIRASSYDRQNTIRRMIDKFTSILDDHPLPNNRNRSRRKSQVIKTDASAISTNIIYRHAAVLGLSSLVLAFPYDTPPKWLPPVLARLARCSDNPHPIAASVKRVLASFKKTHNDTWSTDQKVFTQDELDDVSEPSHSYFV
ncbi:Putative uncharacterized protein [Taphrina deformans PYCC 5710]|uniref:Proteasome activator subunit 4 n=1 Tax=Taphrina deformans (strain PYCC 5710 / ATCC 11124 / CBS 356.35 / IMI 108563 / JCM 9778 / NBRC 8474) TaxID=1097556 RepID=R4XBY6_TAPDE|nr:Putative uncharacterized protein [Taphrina deformans PYCC 5710]|eukprot:CCG83319.1 Putative uncharacterized protein [Taphrina deformans PYCC 5710]